MDTYISKQKIPYLNLQKIVKKLNHWETFYTLGNMLVDGALNMQIAFSINLSFDKDTIIKSMVEVFNSHQILRLKILQLDDGIYFIENNEFIESSVTFKDISKADDIVNFLENEVDRKYMPNDYLWRFTVVKQETNINWLVLSLHHALGDGVTAVDLVNEILTNYVELVAGRELEKKNHLLNVNFNMDKSYPCHILTDDDIVQIHNTAENHEGVDIKYVIPEKRKTSLKTFKIDRNRFSSIHTICKKNNITVNSFLAVIILKTASEIIENKLPVELHTPFDIFLQDLFIKEPGYDYGNTSGVVSNIYNDSDEIDFSELAQQYSSHLKKAIENYNMYKFHENEIDGANILIDILDKVLINDKRTFSFMLSNLGRYNPPDFFKNKINTAYISSSRKACDQLVLFVPIGINGEIFITFSYTSPLIQHEWIDAYYNKFSEILIKYTQQ